MQRLWRAFLWSLSGLKAAWQDEAAFRQEALATTVLMPSAWFLARNGTELALLWGCVLLVLIIELLNTAVEAVTDRAGTDIHPLAKKAKDTASAAVLIALLMAVLVWCCVLWR